MATRRMEAWWMRGTCQIPCPTDVAVDCGGTPSASSPARSIRFDQAWGMEKSMRAVVDVWDRPDPLPHGGGRALHQNHTLPKVSVYLGDVLTRGQLFV